MTGRGVPPKMGSSRYGHELDYSLVILCTGSYLLPSIAFRIMRGAVSSRCEGRWFRGGSQFVTPPSMATARPPLVLAGDDADASYRSLRVSVLLKECYDEGGHASIHGE